MVAMYFLYGVAMLLPFNVLVSNLTFLEHYLPGKTIAYQLTFLSHVCIPLLEVFTLVKLQRISLLLRTNVLYIIQGALLLVIYYLLKSEASIDTKYIFTCIILVLVSSFQGIVEGSNFAFSAFLPSQVFSAFLSGHGAAGVIIVSLRILFFLLLPNETEAEKAQNYFLFWHLMFVVLVLIAVLYCYEKRIPALVQFHKDAETHRNN